MPKRMIDTELWNNEDIIETFTAEDRYFWLYLLTNPHNQICGVLKNSPALIARDMGLHKDTIVNLLYRFENIHKAIYVDKDTNEIFILNWYKFNWTTSPKLLSVIGKEMISIKSETIRKLLFERVDLIKTNDTVSIGYSYPSNTINNNTIIDKVTIESNSNDNSIKDSNTKLVSIENIDTWFNSTYSIYPRKVSKIQGKNTFVKKLQGRGHEEAHTLAQQIYQLLERQIEAWEKENEGQGRKIEYIPHFSSWLNANVPDKPKGNGKLK